MKHQKKSKQEYQFFNVEKIVGKRYDPETNELQYCIKWEGYPDEENTWEPVENLQNVLSFVQEYEAYQNSTRKKPKIQLDDKKLKNLLLIKLNQFLEQMAPKYELQEINLSDFDSSEEIKEQQQHQETQPKATPEQYEPKSHILTQGFHWCPQNYESNIDY
ncbi:unnamed protein product (macronuclear) [Paramecium tetraurelia]|uniref:Chromo domain-containing protein n=1 Tax=Paramecium tetraurelia TaxID=5888 RepID=A0CK88_PARTE|nr:uncharacterized protein GSPATT00000918001 [Paramecium tetraurelia]CAK71205.1 unnamed protein product [Paramecium tetraurelia]|eukprot:XP_001438602.1 hypothetical protein (macronuclear) [Paramecium tetraurelia strain d4-2]